MAAAAAANSKFIIWAAVCALMLCLPVASAGREVFMATNEKESLYVETFSIGDSNGARTTLSVDLQNPIESLERSIQALQQTIRTLFAPLTISLQTLDKSIDKVNGLTREAFLSAVRAYQNTLELVFFPILGIPNTLRSLDKSIEYFQEADIKALELSIRSLDNVFQFVFYPFLDMTTTVTQTVTAVQEDTFRNLERSIHQLSDAFRTIFYPFLNILPGPLNLGNVINTVENVSEAELRVLEFGIRSLEESVRIIFLPTRFLSGAIRGGVNFDQQMTLQTLNSTVHDLHRTFRLVFFPFLNVPEPLQPLNNFIEKGMALKIMALNNTIQSVQKAMKFVFFPYLAIPNTIEALERSLNETNVFPNFVNSLLQNVQSLNNILVHIFLPNAPNFPSASSGFPANLNPITYLENVLRSLRDTLARILVPRVSSAPPTSLLNYLYNDLEGLQMVVQNLLAPLTVPSPRNVIHS